MFIPKYSFEWNNNMYQTTLMNSALSQFVPSTFGAFKQSASYAFYDNSLFHGIDYLKGQLEEEKEILTEEQFNDEGYSESGLKYKEGITRTQANISKERFEREKFYSEYMKNSSALSFGAITGMVVGGIADPVNYIPFVGVAGRLAKVANIVRKSPMLAMSANSMAGQATFEVAKQTHYKSLGRDVNVVGGMIDVGIAGLIGFGMGGLGKLSGLRKKIEESSNLEHMKNLSDASTYNADRVPYENTNKDIPNKEPNTDAPPLKNELDIMSKNNDQIYRSQQITDSENTWKETGPKEREIDVNKSQEAINNYKICKGV